MKTNRSYAGLLPGNTLASANERRIALVFPDEVIDGKQLVDFTLAVLGGNDLRGIDLSGCRLRETSLVQTDLRKAVLRGADLSGARTTGTRLDDADLRGATVDASLWSTATLVGARVDVGQAMAFALAHGLRLDG